MSEYTDLPEWVRPGTKADYNGYTVEIVRITPARIVAKNEWNREIQFERTAARHSDCRIEGCKHEAFKARDGHSFNYLKPLFCLGVLRQGVESRRKYAVEAVGRMDMKWGRGSYAERRKTRQEDPNDLLLEWLDEVENTVRKQRDKLLKAIEQYEKRKAEINVEPGA